MSKADFQMFDTWNRTEHDFPADMCLHQLFEEQVKLRPQEVALIFEEERITFEETHNRANELAAVLKQYGVGPDALVAINVERNLALPIGLLGIQLAGGAYVPIDPSYPLDRQQYMLEDSDAKVLLTHRSLLESVDFIPTSVKVVCLDPTNGRPELDSEAAPYTGHACEPAGPSSKPSSLNLAYVIYTSGNTGKPKGVMLQHQGVVNLLYAFQLELGIGPGDTCMCITTFCFDISVLEIFLPLIFGMRLVMATRENATNGPQLMHLLTKHDVTMLQATPTTWQMLMQSGWEGKSNLHALCGGEPMPLHIAPITTMCQSFRNVYGPTETTIWSSCYAIRTKPVSAIPIGKPLINTYFYILDENRNRVAEGAEGELWIGGVGLARGYHNRPELTAEKFVPNPFDDGRMYSTGDLAKFLPSGEVLCLGRIDTQVKIRGYRIECGEVEARLEEHPDVSAAVVVGRDDLPMGVGLVGYVTAEVAGSTVNSAELKEFLGQNLPHYMVPTFIEQMAAFPLTPNAKVDRKAMPKPSMRRLTSQRRSLSRPFTPLSEVSSGISNPLIGDIEAAAPDSPVLTASVAPHQHPPCADYIIDAIIDTAYQVLGMEIEEGSSLTAVGLDSLGSIRFVGVLAKTLQSPSIPLTALYKYKTVTALATHLAAEASPELLETVQRMQNHEDGDGSMHVSEPANMKPSDAEVMELFQGLRGIAAIYVYVDHCGQLDNPHAPGWFLKNVVNRGAAERDADTDIFFILSGYSTYMQQEELDKDVQQWPFLRARWLQLFPMYYLSLLLALPIYIHRLQSLTFTGPEWGKEALLMALTVLGLQSWVPKGTHWFPNVWYVSTQWCIYWFFKPLYHIMRTRSPEHKKPRYTIGLFAIITALYVAVMWTVPMGSPKKFPHNVWRSHLPIINIALFMQGFLMADLKLRTKSFIDRVGPRAWGWIADLIVVGILGCIFGSKNHDGIWDHLSLNLLISSLSSALTFALPLSTNSFIAKLLRTYPIQECGRLAYPIYVTHGPVLVYYCISTGSIDWNNKSKSLWLAAERHLQKEHGPVLIFVFAFVVVLSHLVQHYVQERLLTTVQMWMMKKRKPGGPKSSVLSSVVEGRSLSNASDVDDLDQPLLGPTYTRGI
ncbi:hypothetical protein CYMTET_54746 [Cymbomonas tetramitiformis]|uniref:Carrier domain-containing protein n=1 Tax=Cymbomonas tetramitiformis TaxID=36881 RepID=A0AAE0BFP8_9CHLO|nr:hypothetical protein CYMTET_54746 [Cymbomonas tetramitiformis]